MIPAMLIGALTGLGLLLLVIAIIPPRTDLAAAVGRFDAQRAASPISASDSTNWFTITAGKVALWASNNGLVLKGLRENLSLVGKTLEQHFVSKLAVALIGLLIPTGAVLVLAASGINTGLLIPAFFGLSLAIAFSFLPDLSLAREAEKKRTELRRALSCYLDLVAMSLAGGRGVPEALADASRIGRGWGFDLIADALAHARYAGTSTWEAFSDLGTRVGVSELRDLGGALALVADDGAKIRDSLSSRAATARTRQLAESEGEAERASESIKNAHLMLGFAFLVFLAYPAVAAVMAI